MDVFIGTILLVGFNFAPRGWALCAGQLLPIAQYQALFSLLGTFYGGNGQTNFALPDLRGRSAIGMGQGSGLPMYTIGQNGGSETITLGIANMPAHTHMLNGDQNAGGKVAPGPNHVIGQVSGSITMYSPNPPNTQLNTASIGMSGGNQPVPLRNPYLALNYIIATEGLFPSRN